MSEISAQLSVVKPFEPTDQWTSFCRNPQSFLQEIVERLKVAVSYVNDDIVFSEDVPNPSDRKKIWIKTSVPYAIGKVIDGNYQMDYGMSGFNANIPFQAKAFDPVPAGVRSLSESEIRKYGLYDSKSEIATEKMTWYIFEPAEIKY